AALVTAAVLGGPLVPGAAGALPRGPSLPGVPAPPTAAPTETSVRLASFNVLGSSHTRGADGFASGRQRMRQAVKLLRKHDVAVVGFQELQADQLRTFRNATDGRFAVYPGLAGERRLDSENSLAWQKSRWTAVRKRTFTIPYFGGRKRAMPLVQLRNRATGTTAWFANVHNPASNAARGSNDHWRRQALLKEARLAKRLHHDSGLPVFLTGDMNEREQAFCPLTGRAPLRAARGGSHRDGRCRADNPRYVDWIFASLAVRVTGYVEDRGRLDRRTSDHPVVVSTAHVDPRDFQGHAVIG
ncbi:MAG: hypothetical protein HOQ22_08460, partial [Nocardioidaceae bacterium]|nr:hypothetical protein [Nocardioidaceae bacterium]